MSQLKDRFSNFNWDIKVAVKAMGGLDFEVNHIPELKEPVGGNVIFNGLDFNFNSLLNNSTFNYIYNIYLVAVDFIIVVLFIFLCKACVLFFAMLGY